MKKRLWGLLCAACCVLLLTGAVMAEGHEHCVCGAEHANVGEHTAEASTAFTAWTTADALPTAAGNYYLETDVALAGTWYPADGTTLCLNGHEVKLADDDTNTSLVHIEQDISFTLTDCADQPGSLVLAKSEDPEGGATCVRSSGTFTLYGGRIVGGSKGVNNEGSLTMYGGEISDSMHFGVSNHADCTFLMAGGTISAVDNWGVLNEGEFTLSGGTISDSGTANVYNKSSGTFIMESGTISGESQGVLNEGNYTMSGGKISAGEYNGVYNGIDGTFIMTNGMISDCWNGIFNEGEFTMSGGEISGCKNNSVHNFGGTVTMSGGTVTGNTGETAVSISEGSVFIMNGGSILDNARKGVFNRGTFTMADGTISGHSENGVTNFNSDAIFTMSGGTVSGSDETGIANYGGTFTMSGGTITNNRAGIDNSGTFTMENGIVSDNTELGISNRGSFTMEGGTISGNGKSGVRNRGEFTMEDGTIKNNDTGVWSSGTFIMEGGTVSGSSESHGVLNTYSEDSDGIFILRDGTISDSGHNGVYNWGGTFTMEGGSIRDNAWSGVENGARDGIDGTFTMSGGTISGSKQSGVRNWGGTFTMTGGEVTGNARSGVENDGTWNECIGTFIMQDGTISGNGGADILGGGVSNGGEFTMNGGVITENVAQCGGGVYNTATFTMYDGEISYNTATESGGGVYNRGTFVMDGGTIKRNTVGAVTALALDDEEEVAVAAVGGGVYNEGSVTMTGGAITENAAENGGGVYNAETGSLTIAASESGDESGESATISGNAAVSGGGVYNEGSVTISGGEIKENEATENGGGVYNNGDVTISDGSVTGNDADESGSGVYNNGSVTMTGGSVTGNGTPTEDPDQPDQPVDPDNPEEQPTPSDDIYNNPENENVGFTMSGGEVPEDVTSALIDVTFDPANGEASFTVQCSGTVSKPEDPVRDGYTFLGWYCGDAAWDFAGVITEATTLTARWQQKQTASVSAPATTYAVRIAETAHGSVTADVTRAEKGDTVTLLVSADALYRLQTLTVTDKNGNAVALNENLSFTMPASEVTVTAVFARDFTDVPAGIWYEAAVLWAAENDVTNGVGDGSSFDPDGECTRAQVVTLLWRAAGCPTPNGDALPFTDTESGAWYETAVLWAVENGITKGTGDGTTFSPDETCDRAQIATLLHRFAQLLGQDVSVGEETNILSFDDALTVPDYAFPAMQWACGAGVLQGSGGALLPLKACTRAEIVTMLYRLLG